MSDWLKLVLFACAPLLVALVAGLLGAAAVASKFVGALWAFSVILAYRFTTIRGWWIFAAFVATLGVNYLMLVQTLEPLPDDPEMTPATMAIVATIMMSAACGLGFFVGHATRKSLNRDSDA